MRQTPPGSEPGESAGPSPGLETKMVTKKLKRREHITQVRGGSFSWILFPFIQKKETIFFRPRIPPVPHSRSRKHSRPGGRAPLALPPGGPAALTACTRTPGAPTRCTHLAEAYWRQPGFGGLCLAPQRPTACTPLLPGELPTSS